MVAVPSLDEAAEVPPIAQGGPPAAQRVEEGEQGDCVRRVLVPEGAHPGLRLGISHPMELCGHLSLLFRRVEADVTVEGRAWRREQRDRRTRAVVERRRARVQRHDPGAAGDHILRIGSSSYHGSVGVSRSSPSFRTLSPRAWGSRPPPPQGLQLRVLAEQRFEAFSGPIARGTRPWRRASLTVRRNKPGWNSCRVDARRIETAGRATPDGGLDRSKRSLGKSV
jgi:hypothetical protein